MAATAATHDNHLQPLSCGHDTVSYLEQGRSGGLSWVAACAAMTMMDVWLDSDLGRAALNGTYKPRTTSRFSCVLVLVLPPSAPFNNDDGHFALTVGT
jgi:hypothetical protein